MSRSERIRRPGDYAIPLAAIVEGLAARAEALAHELFPGGQREGHEWRIGSLAGEAGKSLAINIRGTRAGVWSDFASGESGDALDLVAAALFSGNKSEAVRWAKGWLGLDGTDPAALRTLRRAVEKRAETSDDDAKRARGQAFRRFLEASPEIAGTPVEAYLAFRGLPIRRLGFPLRSLRYHPALWCAEVQAKLPAMVAAIVDAKGLFAGLHRTWLAPGGRGKAALAEPKKTWGGYKGGIIRLWRGVEADPETGEVKQSPRLNQVAGPVCVDITEGIEDGLSVAIACPEARVVVGVALASMAAIRWPEQVGRVVFWRQNDPEGSKAEAAAAAAVRAWQAQGKTVVLALPPAGVKDANDVMRGAAP